jgi:hypothetical protein
MRRVMRTKLVSRVRLAVCVLAGAVMPYVSVAEDAPATAAAPTKDSFRGVAFGASFDQVAAQWSLEPAGEDAAPDDPLKVFIRQDEPGTLGSVRLQEVLYYFIGGKFYAVGFCTGDGRQTEILREAFGLTFGAKAHESEGGTALVWPGEKMSAQLKVSLATGEGRALLFDNALQREYEAALLEAARKTAAGF